MGKKHLLFLAALMLCMPAASALAVESALDASLPQVRSLRDIHHFIKLGSSLVGGYTYRVPDNNYSRTDPLHTLYFQYEFSPFRFIGFEFHGDFSGYHSDYTDESRDDLTRAWGLFGPKFGVGVTFHPIKNKVVDPFIAVGPEFGTYYHDFYEGHGASGFGVQTTVGANFFLGRGFFLGTDVNYSYMNYKGYW